MERLSLDYLRKLHDQQDPNSISIYMPTHRVGNEIRQDQIRFKNMINGVIEILKKKGLRDTEIEHLMKPVEAFRNEAPNWQAMSDGLVIFRSKDHFEVNQFPEAFEELAVVSHRYHLKPLIPLLNGNGLFYVLSLSQNKVAMFEGTRFSIKEIDSTFLPENLANALRIDEFMESQQFHTGGPATAGGGRAALFHGQGGGEDDQKVLIEQFFRKISKELSSFLDDRHVPLVIAGVDYLHPIYQKVNSHKGLLEDGVHGNPDGYTLDDLHEKSWAIVSEVFEKEQQDAAKQFTDLNGSSRVLTSTDEVVPAAVEGRIETLFISTDEHIWGRYDVTNSEMRLELDGETPEDLIDLAAVKTLFQSGKVYGMKRSEMPGGHQVVGIARY